MLTWLLYPALLIAVCGGCGLLVRSLTGVPVPALLLPGLGFAAATCAAHLTTATDATAELTAPVLLALAAAGFVTGWPFDWRGAWRRSIPAASAAAAVFLAYGAPVLASGDATFAGYIKLDDTATWMTLTDRVLEHGRSLDGLAPSSYEATLAFNLGDGYPIGAFLVPGAVTGVMRIDFAWTIQPAMSAVAALLALAMYQLGTGAVEKRWLLALVVFVAAQPALLVGYVLWGGIKEVEAAALIATSAALLPLALDRRQGPLGVVPLALSVAALLAVLSFGGAIWVLPLLLAPLPALWRRGPSELIARAAVFGTVTVIALAALIGGGRLIPPTSSPLTSAAAKGNLLEPLSPWQAVGIWPAEDFRLPAEAGLLTALGIAAAAALAVVGIVSLLRSRLLAPALYVAGGVVAGLALVLVGSPWVEGKALATMSPAVCFAAALGCCALIGSPTRWKWAGVAGLCVLALGVVGSNLLGYRAVNLAPRDQLAELEEIGHEIAGQGPTLMTEYNPYGVRHFLRDSDPEGASELRRRRVPLRDGRLLAKGLWADTDAFDLAGLQAYRTLVLRRSPAQSRPPSPYSLLRREDEYEVWQRPHGDAPSGIVHLPLGSIVDPAGVGDCTQLERLAEVAGPGGRLAFSTRPAPNLVVPAAAFDAPPEWLSRSGFLLPRGEGSAFATVEVPTPGLWTAWIGGSVRGDLELLLDGSRVGSAGHVLNNHGLYIRLGAAELGPGRHEVELVHTEPALRPGSGGDPYALGPLVLSMEAGTSGLAYLPAARARELCGRPLDWVEAVPAR